MFDLQDGNETKAPGKSGIAAHDCNCRCYLEYNLMTEKEFAEATNQTVDEVREKYKTVENSENSGIIKEESEKPITKITDNAINNVPFVEVEGMTESECTTLQRQHKELLKYARDNNDNKEVAFVFSRDFSNKTVIKGTVDSLDTGTTLLSKGNQAILLHNHPRNGNFSTTDIVTFISCDNLKTMTIAKNNGTVATITKNSNYDKLKFSTEYRRLYKKIVKSGTEAEKNKFVTKLISKNKSGVVSNGI